MFMSDQNYIVVLCKADSRIYNQPFVLIVGLFATDIIIAFPMSRDRLNACALKLIRYVTEDIAYRCSRCGNHTRRIEGTSTRRRRAAPPPHRRDIDTAQCARLHPI